MTNGIHHETTLTRLINEPKGNTTYNAGEAFLLHVFWECPSFAAAQKLLDALKKCAAATYRDTPCVPVYFFRISSNNADLSPEAPTKINDHPAIQSAKRKLRMGVPRQAVLADLGRKQLSPDLLDLDPDTNLPEELCQRHVAVECTELYLDERAFNEHAGSRDYLAAYGEVMSPALRNRHYTARFGTPTQYLVDRVLDPFLHENVVTLMPGSTVWRAPTARGVELMLSIDLSISNGDLEELSGLVQNVVDKDEAVLQLLFQHPLRNHTARLMSVVVDFRQIDLAAIRALPVERGELFCDQSAEKAVNEALLRAGLSGMLKVNPYQHVGYILHAKAHELVIL